MSSEAGAPFPVDVRAALSLLARVARLEPGVFAEIADTPALNRTAVLMPAAFSFAAAVGALLFNALLFPETASVTGLLARQLVLGTGAGWLAWALWVQVTLALLTRAAIPVEQDRLRRAMGFAVAPYALLLLLVLPDLPQGDRFVFGYLSSGIVAAVVVLVPVWVRTAIREVVPGAGERVATVSCVGGFVVAFSALTLLGTWAGLAPGYSVFLRGDQYL